MTDEEVEELEQLAAMDDLISDFDEVEDDICSHVIQIKYLALSQDTSVLGQAMQDLADDLRRLNVLVTYALGGSA